MYSTGMQRRGQEFGSGAQTSSAYAGPSHHYNENDRAAAEQENDAILKALMSDIKTIKTNSKGIKGELDRQNQLLDLLNDSFLKAQGALGKAMRRVGEVGGMSSHKHMWLLVVFAFFVFLFIWFILKIK